MECEQCSGSIGEGDNYCRFCGFFLHASQRQRRSDPRERKLASILFADIVGSTPLIEGLPPEDAMARLVPLVDTMRSAILEHGGTLCRDQGDGVMAVFGAPNAQSDHAQRACRSGIALAHRIRELHGFGGAVRVGIHSGEIIFHRALVSGGTTYAASGSVVHLASRLESACAPGAVLVSRDTMLLLDGSFSTVGRAALNLKGFTQAIETFELIAPQFGTGQPISPFVGRVAELQALDALADSGAAQAVACIMGEPGLGKSRLAREFIERQRQRDWKVIDIRVDPADASVPFSVLTRLSGLCSRAASAVDQDLTLRSSLQALLNLPVTAPTWNATEPEFRRRQIAQAAWHLLSLEAGLDQRVVVLIDDIHWADRESLIALSRAPENGIDGRILFICTSRPISSPAEEHGWFLNCRRINLEALDTFNAEHFLDVVLGRSSNLLRVKGRIIERAGGAPLLMEETIKWLVATGLLQGTAGNYRPSPNAEDFEVPTSVRSSILERIDRLSQDAKSVLQAASILGPRFSVRLLSTMLRIEPKAALQTLASPGVASFLRPAREPYHDGRRDEDMFMFAHALVSESIESALTLDTRRRLHRQALSAYLACEPSLDRHVERLSAHALEGRDWSRVATFSMRAGQRAIEKLGYRNAAVYFERAIEALYRLPRTADNLRMSIDARLQARVSYGASSQFDLCLRRIAQAEALCIELQDSRHILCKVLRAAAINFMGPPRRSIALARPALSEALATEDVHTAAGAIYVLGQAYYGAGQYVDASTTLAASEGLLTGEYKWLSAGTTGTLSAMCLGLRAAALGAVGQFAEGRSAAEKACSIASKTHLAFDRVAYLFGSGSLLVKEGRPQDALAGLDEAMKLCRIHSIDSFITAIAIPVGEALCDLGRYSQAIDLLADALGEAERLQHMPQLATLRHLLGRALLGTGERERALELAQSCICLSRRNGFRSSCAMGYYVRAIAGDNSTALDDLKRAYRISRDLGAWPDVVRILVAKADILARSGVRRQAGAIARQINAIATAHDIHLGQDDGLSSISSRGRAPNLALQQRMALN